MWISDFAIRRPLVTVVTMLALVVFGTFAIFGLETDEFPELNRPLVTVSVPYPGASPEIVEQEVADPIEEAISSISGLERIESTSLDGFAVITVEFVYAKGVQEATQDIRDAVSQIRGELPPEMEEPIYTRFDPDDLPIVSLTLASDEVAVAELTQVAEDEITPELRAIQGVAEVEVVGGLERELVIEIRPAALQAAGLGIGQVVQAVQAQNLAAPVGRVDGKLEEQTIRLRGRLERPEAFEELVVSSSDGRLVRLGQVATVRDGTEEQRTLALYDGREAVGIDVTKAHGSSTTAVANAVLERVARIDERLPSGIDLAVVRDAGERVRASINSVTDALMEGAFMTVIVIFLFLNSWRSTAITGLALPVSLISSFVAVWLFGFTLNTMSLLGLALAIGILIDDAIVVRENIVRHVAQGKDHYTAAHTGTAEIGLAVTAATLTVVVVFLPIAFMGGIAGQLFRPLALTITCSVLVSLLVSFSLDPMLSAYWPDPHKEEHEKAWITRQLDRFNDWFERQAEGYKRVIGWALDHRLTIIALAVGSFVLALLMPALGIVGSAFSPDSDRSEFDISVETPPGSNLEYTRRKAEEVAQLARTHPEVAYTYTTIGDVAGAVNDARVFVRLVPRAERDRRQSTVQTAVRRDVQRVGGATVALLGGSGLGGADKPVQLQLQGPDVDVLTDLAEQLATELRDIPGAVDVSLSTQGRKPEYDIWVDRGLAGSLGLTVEQIAQTIRPAFAGVDAGDWVAPSGESYKITVRLPEAARSRASDLERLPLLVAPRRTAADASADGGQSGRANGTAAAPSVPLGQVAVVERNVGPAQIDRLDRTRVITVGANVEGRPLSDVTRAIDARLEAFPIPSGYTITNGGDAERRTEVVREIVFALALAILLMYFVLVLQFGSFLDPLAIMLSLPLSLIGVVLALLVTGDTLNMMSLMGIILLMGIVTKNAILLIDFAKWSHESGTPLREALIEAGRVRLRPIVMTSVTLIAGMLPVAMGAGEGADFRAPLGRAIIGGMIASTLLTLVVIPTIYEMLVEWRCAFAQRFRFIPAADGASPPLPHPEPTSD